MRSNEGIRRGFWAEGVPFIWLSGLMVILLIGMILGLAAIILGNGLSQFWPSDIVRYKLRDGSAVLGQVVDNDAGAAVGRGTRTLLRVGNRDVFGLDFKWVNDRDVTGVEFPADAAVIERLEYGRMVAFITGMREGGSPITSREPGFYRNLEEKLGRVRSLLETIRVRKAELESTRKELTALEIRIRELEGGPEALAPETKLAVLDLQKRLDAATASMGEKISGPERELEKLQAEADRYELDVRLSDGQTRTFKLDKAVMVYLPNSMSLYGKMAHYLRNVAGFLKDWPRESNTEGGVYPAIFGTVLMVFIMVVTCTPLGVMTALYMHEYAKAGLLLSVVRLAVNNLAGVPSIVFGIFGLGFYIYFIGGGIDRLFFSSRLPEPTFGTGGILWASLTLALLTVPVVVVSTLEGLATVPRANRDGALALGASKFQMIWRVVLPNAMPGILTGVILAISRAAGEVAPLMITGVVKLVSELPADSSWPFLHLDRKFMHLGFHIYDVGFQSPNVEAAKPMVYATTGLLLLIVITLNAFAILLRNNMRKKYRGPAL